MASFYQINPDTLHMETQDARSAGKSCAEKYQSGEPYNHICIDDFLPDDVLGRVCEDISNLPDPEGNFDNARERLKTSYNPDRLPAYTKALFQSFNLLRVIFPAACGVLWGDERVYTQES